MSYTDAELATAILAAHSWRGVLRHLGLHATSAGSLRAARRRADGAGIDHSHFTGQRRWSDSQLTEAVAGSRSWTEVARRVGLYDGRSGAVVRGHAERLGLDVAHLQRVDPTPDRHFDLAPRPELLRTAAPNLAAAWFLLRGVAVSWPMEPARYDLLVELGGVVSRIQVKTTVARASTRGAVSLSASRRDGRQTYTSDEIDYFFVLDESLDAYLIPVAAVAGRYSIMLKAYEAFRVTRHGQWLTALSEVSAPAP